MDRVGGSPSCSTWLLLFCPASKQVKQSHLSAAGGSLGPPRKNQSSQKRHLPPPPDRFCNLVGEEGQWKPLDEQRLRVRTQAPGLSLPEVVWESGPPRPSQILCWRRLGFPEQFSTSRFLRGWEVEGRAAARATPLADRAATPGIPPRVLLYTSASLETNFAPQLAAA